MALKTPVAVETVPKAVFILFIDVVTFVADVPDWFVNMLVIPDHIDDAAPDIPLQMLLAVEAIPLQIPERLDCNVVQRFLIESVIAPQMVEAVVLSAFQIVAAADEIAFQMFVRFVSPVFHREVTTEVMLLQIV